MSDAADTFRFQRCMRWLRSPGIEGDFSNDATDHGGPTLGGISTPTFLAAQKRGFIPPQLKSVSELSQPQIEIIYYWLFWMEYHCPDLPVPLDLLAFDAFVQHDPHDAGVLMQTAVGSDRDGIIGPQTLKAAKLADPTSAIERYSWAREALYNRIVHDDPPQKRFIKGWINRVMALRSVAVSEIAATA